MEFFDRTTFKVRQIAHHTLIHNLNEQDRVLGNSMKKKKGIH